ncbi:MAG: hypothetical protein WAL85_13215 [Candidatus Korobacteraceae bacterium]
MTQSEDAVSDPEPLANGGTAWEFSLIRGGPLYRAQQAAGLIAPNRWNHGRRLIFALAIGWLPLVILTALFHPSLLNSLLRDYRIYARLVIAVPVLLVGQTLMESRFRLIVQHLRAAKLLAPDDLASMDRTITTLVRWADSRLPELLIVALVYVNTAVIWHQRVAQAIGEHWAWAVMGTGSSAQLTPAAWYFGLVSQVLYRLLVGVALWKWLLWTCYLFKLSRLDLKLVATHPDHHGGIGFLGLSPMAFAPIAFAISAAIGSNWREQILSAGAHLTTFKIQGVVLLAVILLMAMGPLVFFVPRLTKLRRQGILQYGTLAQIHSTDFHEKWILHRAGHEEEFLAAPEASTLTDYGASYENIEAMQPFPFDKGGFLALALAVAVPMIPAVLAQIPLAVALKDLVEAAK